MADPLTPESSIRRLLLASALAPATAPLVYITGMLLGSGYPYSADGHMQKFFDEVLVTFIMSYLATLSFGLPMIYLLYRATRLTTANCLLSAASLGFVGLPLFLLQFDGSHNSHSATHVLVFGLLGALAATLNAGTFCLVSRLPLKTSYSSASRSGSGFSG